MGKARHPVRYKEGPSKQITVPWKRRVLSKLAENKTNGKNPANVEQLRIIVKAKKGGLNKTLDLDLDPPRLTSKYADDITAELGIDPPLVETDEDDPGFWNDVRRLRALSAEARSDLMRIAEQLAKK